MRTLISIGAAGILVIIGILISLPPAVVQSAPATSGAEGFTQFFSQQCLLLNSGSIQIRLALCLDKGECPDVGIDHASVPPAKQATKVRRLLQLSSIPR